MGAYRQVNSLGSLDAPVVAIQEQGVPAAFATRCQEAGDLIAALVATGSPRKEAMTQAVVLHGAMAVWPFFEDYLAAGPRVGGARDFNEASKILDEVASVDPDAANAWLSAGLARGRILERRLPGGVEGLFLDNRDWITSLPPGMDMRLTGWLNAEGCRRLCSLPKTLEVEGFLTLTNCVALERLPDGLRVAGDLWLDGCAALKCLPAGLVVRQALSLVKCPAWDGRIPEDAHVGGLVFTDRHTGGIGIRAWRKAHGSRGERDG